MRLRAVLAGFLLLSVSCNERGASTNAQGLPVDERVGLARLDSAYELNDPYAGFERPAAAVTETPWNIRDRFRKDLEAMFGADSISRVQLDSGREIIVFMQQLAPSLRGYILHVSDIIAGDCYFLYLNQGKGASPAAWQWYGPAPDSSDPLRVSGMPLIALDSTTGRKLLQVNEFRRNGNIYHAWIRTLANIGRDLGVRPELRFEAASLTVVGGHDLVISRTARYDGTENRFRVRAVAGTRGHEAAIGSVSLVPHGTSWRIAERRVIDKRYKNLIWSANPLGEDAVLNNFPSESEGGQR